MNDNTGLVVHPESYSKTDLVQIVASQDAAIQTLGDAAQLPLLVDVGAEAATAYTVSRVDAALDAGGAVKASVAAAALAASVALAPAAPNVAKGARSIGKSSLCALLSDVGREHGLKDLAEREKARLAKAEGK
jgi:hypothetical protein